MIRPPILNYLHRPLTKTAVLSIHKKRQGKESLLRAVRIKHHPHAFIFDATAGLGKDAFVMAVGGYRVVMCERVPRVAEALAVEVQQLKRLKPEIDLTLITQDSKTYLQSLSPSEYPDVIYLDPMFPERNKTALVKKALRDLRAWVGDDLDADELLQMALQKARYKVVVKRPRLAPVLGGITPTSQIIEKTCRWDVVVVATPPPTQG